MCNVNVIYYGVVILPLRYDVCMFSLATCDVFRIIYYVSSCQSKQLYQSDMNDANN